LQLFSEDGYLVAPQVVPSGIVEAARVEIQNQVRKDPPASEHRGPHFYFLVNTLPDPLTALLFDSQAIKVAESLIAPGKFDAPDHVQIALNIPPWDHRPGTPHVDGLTPPEASGRPGTFTLLAGILLTDQTTEDCGNLWVWPGSHRSTSDYLRVHGTDKLITSIPYPPVDLPEPRPVLGRTGDLLLAHYLLGHNMGGNTSSVTREAVYFRLRREGHREHWRDFMQDPLLEFEPVRAALKVRHQKVGVMSV
jgi:hypothetical protein